ncbi:hypothetical protein AZE42_01742 [Rhizopogon vesiculosus]|uniref:T6SS Phospholipase effector Tle1-like catalytic domain-containing protein n=1 Tax=Rhizopogon vesiculosus TaxID=180088 RepID=A0A1J8QHH6_9AGAM|nr:hypothetical protein AZE42_01742 [Rhizopogon vesiculosus]
MLSSDGTGDQFDSDNSNVVQLFNMLVKDKPSQQMVYYQSGIGTYTIPQMATPLMAKMSKTVDMMFGHHLDAHVMGGYEFIMQNYEYGDKICIFGFSRGAYTARALAGMVHKVGIIPRCNHQQVPFAYNMYIRDDVKGWEESTAFKKTFSINADIEFVGVWDTVSSVGLIPKRLPFTRANDNIKFFRHALSLDERRVRFKPTIWERPTKQDMDKGGIRHGISRGFPHNFLKRRDSQDGIDTSRSRYDDQYPLLECQHTDVEEVWFAGHHCDVGGSSVKNNTRNSLARIPLRWMIRECFKAEVGILFHRDMFKEIGMDYATLHPRVLERPNIIHHSPCPSPRCPPDSMGQDPTKSTDPAIIYGDFISEELEDVADAISRKHDKLIEAWRWWILEYTPQPTYYQDDNDNHDVIRYKINMGHGRYIPRQNRDVVKVHRSVQIRIKADCLENGKYRPNAKLEVEPKWVP